MTTPSTGAPAVMLVPVTGGTGDGNLPTSPPQSPWQLGIKRFWSGALILLPFLLTYMVDPLIESWSKTDIPDEYKPFAPILSGAILAYQAWRKQSREQSRKEAGDTLKALGVPIGEPMDAATARGLAPGS